MEIIKARIKSKLFMFTLLLTVFFSVTVYAEEGMVYYHGEPTEYKTYLSDTLYIPFYIYADFLDGEITWDEANQEATLKVPIIKDWATVTGEELKQVVVYYCEYKVKANSNSFDMHSYWANGEYIGSETWDYESGHTFIKDGRLMVPAYYDGHGQGYTYLPDYPGGVNEFELYGYEQDQYNINFIDRDKPLGDNPDFYKIYMIDRDKWILPGDKEYFIDFISMYGDIDNDNDIDSRPMRLILKGKDGKPITLYLHYPVDDEEMIKLRREGIFINGVFVRYNLGPVRTVFGKESILNIINGTD